MLLLAVDKFCRKNFIVSFPFMDGESTLVHIAWGSFIEFGCYFPASNFPNFQDHCLLFPLVNLP
jgi:hypothetical protein